MNWWRRHRSAASHGGTSRSRATHRQVGRPIEEAYLDLSDDGSSLVISGRRSSGYDVPTGDLLFRFDPPSLEADAEWSHDATAAAVAAGGEVRLHHRQVRRAARRLRRTGEFNSLVARFSPDDDLLAVALVNDLDPTDAHVTLWDLSQHQELRTIEADGAFDMAFDPAGARLATAGGDGSILVWDVATGDLLQRLNNIDRGPGYHLQSRRNRDRRRHAGGVKVFEVATGSEVLLLRGLPGFVRSVAFSPDGTRSWPQGPGEILIWTLDVDLLMSIAQDRVTRTLTPEECQQYLRADCP